MVGLGEATEEAEQILDKFGDFTESYGDWSARLAEEEKQRQEEITDNLKTEADERKSVLEKLAEAQKTMADRVYELTHTALENNIRKLGEQKQSVYRFRNGTEKS